VLSLAAERAASIGVTMTEPGSARWHRGVATSKGPPWAIVIMVVFLLVLNGLARMWLTDGGHELAKARAPGRAFLLEPARA